MTTLAIAPGGARTNAVWLAYQAIDTYEAHYRTCLVSETRECDECVAQLEAARRDVERVL